MLINRDPKAAKLEEIPGRGYRLRLMLFGTGILGGMVSGLLGSGLDIIYPAENKSQVLLTV